MFENYTNAKLLEKYKRTVEIITVDREVYGEESITTEILMEYLKEEILQRMEKNA